MADATTLIIPPELAEKYPALIDLIVKSESMNDGERQYWINILPVMTPDQQKSLQDILQNERNQLAAIDEKYAKAMQQVGQERAVEEIAEKREAKHRERAVQEGAEKEADSKATEALLQQIEGGNGA